MKTIYNLEQIALAEAISKLEEQGYSHIYDWIFF